MITQVGISKWNNINKLIHGNSMKLPFPIEFFAFSFSFPFSFSLSLLK